MRPWSVHFATDPEGLARLVMAQDGPRFLVARCDSDPEDLAPLFWFEADDARLRPSLGRMFYGDDESWGQVFSPTPGAAPHAHAPAELVAMNRGGRRARGRR